MRLPTTTELLEIWEQGINQTVLQKSLHLLSAACSMPDLSEVARLSIGERDARLLQLREWMFGSRLVNTADCPQCGEQVEWETVVNDFRLQTIRETPAKIFDLQHDGYTVRFRLPNSEDITRATRQAEYRSNPKKLLADCILDIQGSQKDTGVNEIPDHILDLLNQRMAQEDPQADIRMVLNCPECACTWEAPFNILSYLWVEIDVWARHILQEVYLLARAFSWSERDILNLSSHRRQLYLNMLRS